MFGKCFIFFLYLKIGSPMEPLLECQVNPLKLRHVDLALKLRVLPKRKCVFIKKSSSLMVFKEIVIV
jgi:hypothetical protein